MVSSSEVDDSLERDRNKSRNPDSTVRHGRRNKSDRRRDKREKSRKRNYSDSSVSSYEDSYHQSARKEKTYHSSDESDQSSSHEDRKRRKKEMKKYEKKRKSRKEKKSKKKKKKKRSKRDDSSSSSDEEEVTHIQQQVLAENFLLADSLYNLFKSHPEFIEDLPILLVRLAGGTTFDLRRMPHGPGQALAGVFACLKPFGVTEESGSWKWNKPATNSRPSPNQELVLVKVVRSMIDELGITMEAIEQFENPTITQEPATTLQTKQASRTENTKAVPMSKMAQNSEESNDRSLVVQETTSLLQEFRKNNERSEELANELAGLCQMILQGESISLDGLPDENLRDAIESLFETCGLEKSEMEDEDSDDEDRKELDSENGDRGKNIKATFGYGLPDVNDTNAKILLSSAVDVCRGTIRAPDRPTKRTIQGPVLPPTSKDSENLSSDDEGPLLLGTDKSRTGLPAFRAQKVEGTTNEDDNIATVREEWMLVPGKFDFLSAIKSGQPIRSRGFEGKRKAENGTADLNVKPVDPSIRAEINAMQQAQEEARGPSLMEIHRKQRAEEKGAMNQEQKGNRSDDWKWNRDKDLDAGRRVDKDALNMILGGAGKDLKTKFQGSSL